MHFITLTDIASGRVLAQYEGLWPPSQWTLDCMASLGIAMTVVLEG
jgi:hypothetical protein